MGRQPKQPNEEWLNHFYTYGEAYEALDLCSLLDLAVARLVREHLLSAEDAASCKERVAEVRTLVNAIIPPT